MATGTFKRKQGDRVAGFVLPPGQLARTFDALRRSDVLTRIGLCAALAILLWLLTAGWAPPFAYRPGYIPQRNIFARVKFEQVDTIATEDRNRKKQRELLAIYVHDPKPLLQLQQSLKNKVFQVIRAEKLEDVDKLVWDEFYVAPTSDKGEVDPEREQKTFAAFRDSFAMDMDLAKFESAVRSAMKNIESRGLLKDLEHGMDDFNLTAIMVHPLGDPGLMQRVEVKDVRIAEVSVNLEQWLLESLRTSNLPVENVDVVGKLVFHWLRPRLPVTLKYDEAASKEAAKQAIEALPPVMKTYIPGIDKLADGGRPLSEADIKLLHEEYTAQMAKRSWWERFNYSLAVFGMYVAMFTLCGSYLYHNNRRVLTDLRRFVTILGLMGLTVLICCVSDDWRAEIIPLLLFGMTVAIAYNRELALLVSASVAIVVTITAGYSMHEFIILSAAVAAAILLTGRIRSRTKLIYIGAATGAVAMLTAIGVGTLAGQAYGTSGMGSSGPMADAEAFMLRAFPMMLLIGGTWFGFCGVLSGLLMTGLLPFIERLFDIQTDISLLELGDVAHPLLQELVRRAPGTYNHSINVASIGDAAAEAIGANGLLVRVGAYFHDIGKMLKPGYFVENQGQDQNRHDSLVPAMSTLVIIAHVKDGADLARQHSLPQSIIDFIEQHHGTTLVEYFYRQAAKQSSTNPNGSPVDESSFRYPGPKPQSKETAVLMLADACESASRALADPSPARLESLVHDIALKRLLDGQFEECGLSLQELHIIEDTLVKSLTAVYHGRVKYPTAANTA
jgi:putative nucleotidyltransferase with HDIG domain